MIEQFRCLVALEKFRNFHKAAEALGTTQPTLSRQVQRLEAELGLRLFDRARGLEPTVFGREVLKRARSILLDVTELKRDLDEMRGLTKGELSVACGQLVAQTWIADAVTALMKQHPSLEVKITQEEWWTLTRALREQGAELAVGDINDPERDPDIVYEAMPKRQGVFCCRKDHPLTRGENVSLEDVCRFPMVAPRMRPSIAAQFPDLSRLGKMSEDGRYFVPRICASNLDMALRIAAETDAIAISIPAFAARAITGSSIVVLPVEASSVVTNYGIMYLRGRMLSPSAAAFRAAALAAERSYFADPGLQPNAIRPSSGRSPDRNRSLRA